VQVFQDKEYRLTFGKVQEDGDDGFQGLLPLSLWGEVERSIVMLRDGQGEQRRKELNRFLPWKSILAQHLFEFAEFLISGVLCLKLQQSLKQICERKQCRVLSVLHTPTFPSYMWFVRHVVLEHLYQTTLANACIPRE
jgi:hypothetical protein